jgi:ribosomal protein S18 acetylase RimI-like enzyme
VGSRSPLIRRYRPADRAAVVRLLAGSDPWKRLGYGDADWDRLFESIRSGQGREGYVVEAEAGVVGVALLRERFLLGAYLELLAIAPEARGEGLGSALLAHLESLVFAQARNLFVCVSDFNEGARRFYARHGYQEIGPIPDLLIPGSSELLLRKTIGPVRQT